MSVNYIGENPENYWILHFDEKIRYFFDDIEDANLALKESEQNSDLPWILTRLTDFGIWCKDYEPEY